MNINKDEGEMRDEHILKMHNPTAEYEFKSVCYARRLKTLKNRKIGLHRNNLVGSGHYGHFLPDFQTISHKQLK